MSRFYFKSLDDTKIITKSPWVLINHRFFGRNILTTYARRPTKGSKDVDFHLV